MPGDSNGWRGGGAFGGGLPGGGGGLGLAAGHNCDKIHVLSWRTRSLGHAHLLILNEEGCVGFGTEQVGCIGSASTVHCCPFAQEGGGDPGVGGTPGCGKGGGGELGAIGGGFEGGGWLGGGDTQLMASPVSQNVLDGDGS